MSALPRLKPAGGISSVAVVPAGSAAVGSPAAIAAAAEPVPLVDERSSYEEICDSSDGIVRVEHRLTIAVPLDYARSRFGDEECRMWASAGTAAIVETVAGERLAVGWSERLGSEQPLRLVRMKISTGTSPREIPAAVLTFRSVDGSQAVRIQD